MKKWIVLLLSVAAVGLLFSCRTVTIKRKMYPQLYSADSVYLMYYTTPGNPRFFKLAKLYDTLTFRPVTDDANGNIIDSVTGCTTEGKLYFYEGKDAVHTIYFSRAATCRSLYFIKTGVKYFTRMSDGVKEWLDKMEPQAVELKSANEQ
jgi:hypothetical protein